MPNISRFIYLKELHMEKNELYDLERNLLWTTSNTCICRKTTLDHLKDCLLKKIANAQYDGQPVD